MAACGLYDSMKMDVSQFSTLSTAAVGTVIITFVLLTVLVKKGLCSQTVWVLGSCLTWLLTVSKYLTFLHLGFPIFQMKLLTVPPDGIVVRLGPHKHSHSTWHRVAFTTRFFLLFLLSSQGLWVSPPTLVFGDQVSL